MPRAALVVRRDQPWHRSVPGKPCRRLLPVLACVALFACGGRDALTGLPAKPSAMIAAGTPLDGAIDPQDSWAVADVVIESAVTTTADTGQFVDPVTMLPSKTVTVTGASDTSVFQTGFTSAGEPVAVTAASVNEPDEPGDVRRTRMLGATVTDYTATGQLVPDSPAEAASGADPIVALPPVQGTELYDALVAPEGSDPADTGATCVICAAPAASGAAPSGGTRMLVPVAVSRTANSIEVVYRAAEARGNANGRIRRRYAKHGDRWLLDEIENVREESVDSHKTEHSSRMKFRNVRFHENKEKNAARRARAASTSIITVPEPRIPERMVACDGECGGSSEPPPPPPSPAPGVWGECGEVVPGIPGDNRPGIVFQHGIWSDACTWKRTKPWVLANFYVGGHATISTNSVSMYDEQRDQLANAVNAMADDRLILIGHSNGGIVSRRMAQQIASYNPGRLQGVITLDSPHLGAPAMNTGVTAARFLGRTVAAGFLYLCATNQRGCGEAQMMAGATGVFAKLDNFANMPLYNEMAPNSAFRSRLNGVTESFKKVGVVSHSQDRFLWARMVGDMRCDPDSDCGGREQVHRTKRFQKHLKYTAIIGGLLAIGATIAAQPYIAETAAKSALQAGGMYALLEIFDVIYHWVVSPHDESDGIVPVNSQRYPRADQLYDIYNADSHVGTTRSPWVQDRIYLALTNGRLFVVSRRQ